MVRNLELVNVNVSYIVHIFDSAPCMNSNGFHFVDL
jgi:hypothetical protein